MLIGFRKRFKIRLLYEKGMDDFRLDYLENFHFV